MFFFWLFSLAGRRNQAAAFWAYLICYVILGHVVPWVISLGKVPSSPDTGAPPITQDTADKNNREDLELANGLGGNDASTAWPPPLHTNPPALPIAVVIPVEAVNARTTSAKTIQERLAETESNVDNTASFTNLESDLKAPLTENDGKKLKLSQNGPLKGTRSEVYYIPTHSGFLNLAESADNPINCQYMLRVQSSANDILAELSLSTDHVGQEVIPYDICQNRYGLLSPFVESEGDGENVYVLSNGTVRLDGNVWLVVEKIKVRFT
jgi:hypothetical protein